MISIALLATGVSVGVSSTVIATTTQEEEKQEKAVAGAFYLPLNAMIHFDNHIMVKKPEPPKYKDVNETVYSMDALRLRESASENSKTFFTVAKGTPLTRTKINYIDKFDTIIYNNKNYYVNNEYITTTKPASVALSVEKQIAEANKPKVNYNSADLRLMSALIHSESGNQPLAGQQAVGIVVMNRKESTKFKQFTIKDVIYAPGQFHVVKYGGMARSLRLYDSGKLPSASIAAAKYALAGNKSVYHSGKTYNVKDCYYFATSMKWCKFRLAGHEFR